MLTLGYFCKRKVMTFFVCFLSWNMESEDAVEVFARSVEARNLIYKTYVGDGDSKAYSIVRDSMPYGLLTYIVKEECKSHINKTMGAGLRSIGKNYIKV